MGNKYWHRGESSENSAAETLMNELENKPNRTFKFKDGTEINFIWQPVRCIWIVTMEWREVRGGREYNFAVDSPNRSGAVRRLRLRITKIKNPKITKVQGKILDKGVAELEMRDWETDLEYPAK